MRGDGRRALNIPADVIGLLDPIAETLDVSVSSALACLVRGAVLAGQGERFVIAGIERSNRDGLTLYRYGSMGIGLDKWISDHSGGRGRGASVWTRGPWTLRFHGRYNAKMYDRNEDEGWYLTGPSCEPGKGTKLDGATRSNAIREASIIVTPLEHDRPARAC